MKYHSCSTFYLKGFEFRYNNKGFIRKTIGNFKQGRIY